MSPFGESVWYMVKKWPRSWWYWFFFCLGFSLFPSIYLFLLSYVTYASFSFLFLLLLLFPPIFFRYQNLSIKKLYKVLKLSAQLLVLLSPENLFINILIFLDPKMFIGLSSQKICTVKVEILVLPIWWICLHKRWHFWLLVLLWSDYYFLWWDGNKNSLMKL